MPTPLLAAKLVELRSQHGLSQQQVAECLGMSREGYSHYERNAREPSLEAIVRLSKLYRISVSELVNEKTVLLPETTPTEFTIIEKSGFAEPRIGLSGIMAHSTPPAVIKNIEHFLKLFTGRNTNLDVTDITKEDIAVLEQYKRLDKQSRKEVRQFIKFKHYTAKSKE